MVSMAHHRRGSGWRLSGRDEVSSALRAGSLRKLRPSV
jgi:hypothetical protein